MKYLIPNQKVISTVNETLTKQLVKLNRSLAELNRSTRFFDALKLFGERHSSHFLRPDHYTLSTVLSSCVNIQDIAFGRQLHAHAIRAGLKAYPHVANTLLLLYAKVEDFNSVRWLFGEIQYPDAYSRTIILTAFAKSGNIFYACELFDQMPKDDVAVWNALISGCVENGDVELAMNFFRHMHKLDVRHDNYTFASMLSLCSPELLEYGSHVHAAVIKTGYLFRTSVLNSLITMYFNCHSVTCADKVFEEEYTVYDHITYNAMIDGLVTMERIDEAFLIFKMMQEACLYPTELTFISIFSSAPSARVGSQVQAQVSKRGFLAWTSVNNAMMTMYSNCGDLAAVADIFKRLEEKDLVSWNVMISSYTQMNNGISARLTYLQMTRGGTKPDEFTFGSLLAVSEFSAIVEMIHSLAIKRGLMTTQISNALVSGYSRHGKINQAYEVFMGISCKSLISWNAIISALLLSASPELGLEQFSEMVKTKIKPNVFTFTLILAICGSLSALRLGKQVHGFIIQHTLLQEISLGNALVTMYAKCGAVDWSCRVFNAMVERDAITWNALISAYAQHGEGHEAVSCFKAMQISPGIIPDQATFTSVLSACSHAGLVHDGIHIFHLMVNNYKLVPSVDHFSCIVDLLSRCGYLDDAEKIINKGNTEAHSNMWWSLFSSCAAHNNLQLGRIVAQLLLESEPDNPTIYVILSNIYAAAGQWQEAADLRGIIRANEARKQPGCSWIGS